MKGRTLAFLGNLAALCILALVITQTVVASPAAQVTQWAEARQTLNVRSGPGFNFSVIGQIKPGTLYPVVGLSGNWYAITYGVGVGYVHKAYVRILQFDPASGYPAGALIEAKSTVNVRSGPGTEYTVVGQIRPGTLYVVTGETGLWYSLLFAGQTVWVHKNYVVVSTAQVPTPTPVPPPPGSSHNLTNIQFRVEKEHYAPNEQIWFEFSVTNGGGEYLEYGYLGVSVYYPSGVLYFFHLSWQDSVLPPGDTLGWRDHVEIGVPGRYSLYLSICYERRNVCDTYPGGWELLSPAVTVTIQ